MRPHRHGSTPTIAAVTRRPCNRRRQSIEVVALPIDSEDERALLLRAVAVLLIELAERGAPARLLVAAGGLAAELHQGAPVVRIPLELSADLRWHAAILRAPTLSEWATGALRRLGEQFAAVERGARRGPGGYAHGGGDER